MTTQGGIHVRELEAARPVFGTYLRTLDGEPLSWETLNAMNEAWHREREPIAMPIKRTVADRLLAALTDDWVGAREVAVVAGVTYEAALDQLLSLARRREVSRRTVSNHGMRGPRVLYRAAAEGAK